MERMEHLERTERMDSPTYRNLIGRFATGITVITTEAGGLLHGMTANAITSVSLEPLLLLVCVDHQTQCIQQLERAAGFGVNVLRHDQEHVSALFAQSYEPEAGTLRGLDFVRGAEGVPLLADCLVRFACSTDRRFPAGDHDIFLGRVLAGELVGDAEPLLYYDARYRRLQQLAT